MRFFFEYISYIFNEMVRFIQFYCNLNYMKSIGLFLVLKLSWIYFDHILIHNRFSMEWFKNFIMEWKFLKILKKYENIE